MIAMNNGTRFCKYIFPTAPNDILRIMLERKSIDGWHILSFDKTTEFFGRTLFFNAITLTAIPGFLLN